MTAAIGEMASWTRVPAEPEPGRPRSTFGWPAGCVLALVVATTYQLRLRTADRAVEGDVDLQIVLEVLVYGAVGAYALTRLRLSGHGPPLPLVVVTGLYTSVVALSVLHSPVPSFALVRFAQWSAVLVLVAALGRAATRNQLHGVLHAFVGLVVVSSAGGWVTGFTYPSQIGRYTWWNMHPNQSGLLLGIATVALTAYVLDRRLACFLVAPRWVYVVVSCVVVVSLLATQSRTAIGGAVIGAFVVLVMSVRHRADALVIGGMLLAIAVMLGSSTATTFLLRDQDPEEFGSLSTRTYVWDFAVDKIGEQPLLGHGYGASRAFFSYSFSEIGGAHNAYLETALDMGLTGAALLVVLLLILLGAVGRRARRATGTPAADAPLLFGILVLLITESFTAQGLGQPATIQTVWLMVAMGWVLSGDSSGGPRPDRSRDRRGSYLVERGHDLRGV